MTRSKTPRLLLAILLLALALASCQPSPQEWYSRGVSALDRGDWAEAASAFGNAGDLADAPERAAEALALVSDADTQYDAARVAMRAKRWPEAYAALQQVLAVDPNYPGAASDLAQVTSELEALLTQGQAQLDADNPSEAAALFAAAGDYRGAAARAAKARTLAEELTTQYDRLATAVADGDWAMALQLQATLTARAPGYRDVARQTDKRLRLGYRAAEQALAAGRQAEALAILTAVEALSPGYEDTHRLLQEARVNAVDELLGVHPYPRLIGKDRGWELRLDSVEVRFEGELLVRATVTNGSTLPNHLVCLKNEDEHPAAIYLRDAQGAQILPSQLACEQWGAQAWDLPTGESMSFWWAYPPLADITAPFTLVFAPWGEARISLVEP